ncbi:NUDIX domain-containing protein [Exiguobacterium flavidum]|uniref:NUDIX domain-containing protein n=1 Tax=Exiguobacterium flavidum TaxID=2184695 RepID=UPI000DF78E6E|nr:NUDIX domain-containing protein [Exiguobacterium flavidum]
MIRNSAKAVIIEDGKVLLTKNIDAEGCFYLFPGGGQEQGETLHEAVVRECIEELGEQVEAFDLLHIREYIGQNHEFAIHDADVHQIEFYFACRLLGRQVEATQPDVHQTGIEWVPLAALENYRVYPMAIRPVIAAQHKKLVYLGDVN